MVERGRHPDWLAATAVLLSVGIGRTQQHALRVTHPGRVLDAASKAVAGAEVTFVSAPRLGAAPDDDDVAHATTGADGRFRVELVPTRSYQSWAIQRLADTAFVSQVGRTSGTSTTLRLLPDEQRIPERCQVQLADEWREQSPLRIQILVAGSAAAMPELTIEADGSVVLPPLPHAAFDVRLFARDRLVHVWTSPGHWTRPQPLRAPKPMLVPVRVVDDKGLPVPGALVARSFPSSLEGGDLFATPYQLDSWPLAVVGEDGRAKVLVAAADPIKIFLENLRGLRLVATSQGFAAATAPKSVDGELVFTLEPENGSSGELRNGGTAVYGARFLATDLLDAGGTTASPWRSVAAKFAVPAAPRRHPRLPPDLQLAWVSGRPLTLAHDDPFQKAAASHPLLLDASELTKEGGVDLASVVPIRIQVLDATGGPAVSVTVYATPATGKGFVDPTYAVRLVTDASGRAVLAALPGTWFLFVEHERHFAAALVEAGKARPVETLRLQPFARMLVQVVDRNGKAVQGVRVSPANSVQGGKVSALDTAVQVVARQVDRRREVALTDAHGRTEVTFIECLGIERYLTIPRGRKKTVPLQASSKPVEIVIE